MYEGGSTVYRENSCWCVHVCTSEHLEWLIPYVQQNWCVVHCGNISPEDTKYFAIPPSYSILKWCEFFVNIPFVMRALTEEEDGFPGRLGLQHVLTFRPLSLDSSCLRWVCRSVTNYRCSAVHTYIHTYMYILHSFLAYRPPYTRHHR